MKKKYLDTIKSLSAEAEEFTMLKRDNELVIVKSDSESSDQLVIHDKDFEYPMYTEIENIEHEIAEKIYRFFEISRDKKILVQYGSEEERKLMCILLEVRIAFAS